MLAVCIFVAGQPIRVGRQRLRMSATDIGPHYAADEGPAGNLTIETVAEAMKILAALNSVKIRYCLGKYCLEGVSGVKKGTVRSESDG